MPDPVSCCPCAVERHAYNGCADCPCDVPWYEHPERDTDTTPSGHEARVAELQRLRADVAQANGTLSKIRDVLPAGPALYLWDVISDVVNDRDRLKSRCAELDEFYAAMQGVNEGTPLDVVRMMTAERDRWMNLHNELHHKVHRDDTDARRRARLAEADLAAAKARIDELLITVKNLSLTTPYPEEAGSVQTLIAEVGTLKARVAELERRTGGGR